MPRVNIEDAATKAKRTVKRKRIPKKINKAKTPGEIQRKKNIAVILRVGTYTYPQIADAIGETRGTVKAWFDEPAMQKQYEAAMTAISGAARQFLELLTIDAVKRLAELVYSRDEKIALDAIREILDRGGLPKLSRVEKKETGPHPSEQTNEMTVHLDVRTPEDAERINSVLAEAEKATRETA